MKTVKIFIASSIVEFERERDKLKREMDALPSEHQLKMDFCEDYPDTWTPERTQERYNKLVRQCDFFFAIIGAKVGKATLEEIEIARKEFKKSGNAFPKIVVFFKDLPLEELSAEVIALREEIRGVMGLYPPKFNHVSEITRDILKNLIRYRVFSHPEAFQAIRDEHAAMEGRIKANRQEIALLYEPSHGEITEQNQYKLMVLYRENAELSKKGLFEWETLYEYASFLHKWSCHLDAIITGTELKALKARYVPADYDEPDDRAALENLLGDCCAALERYEDAERYYRAALDIYRELAEAEPDDYAPDVAETCAKLAEILVTTYRYEAAERLYREALTLYLCDWEKYAEEIGQICRTVRRLLWRRLKFVSGVLYIGQVQAEEAELLQTATRDSLLHWLEAFPCPDTAAAYMEQIEAQACKETQDKPDDYEQKLAGLCFWNAKWLYEHNQMELAEVLARKALEICYRLKNEGRLFSSCNLLAMILYATERPNEAERHFKEAIEIGKRNSTFEAELAKEYHNLASLLHDTKRYAGAEKYHQKALEIFQKLAKEDSDKFEPNLLSSYLSLAGLSLTIKQYGKSENFSRKALSIGQRLAQKDHDQFDYHWAMSCQTLANALAKIEPNEEADKLFRQALEIFQKLVERDQTRFEPDLATAHYNYGLFLLTNKGDHTTALGHVDKAIVLWARYPRNKEWLDEAIRVRSKCQREIWARHGQ
ncbi:MAG: tetratricopeptide repeat protein [Oscillibacter sp.]|nr:tetratricopeptide repeat protein [Oscillibacter sp.]